MESIYMPPQHHWPTIIENSVSALHTKIDQKPFFFV